MDKCYLTLVKSRGRHICCGCGRFMDEYELHISGLREDYPNSLCLFCINIVGEMIAKTPESEKPFPLVNSRKYKEECQHEIDCWNEDDNKNSKEI